MNLIKKVEGKNSQLLCLSIFPQASFSCYNRHRADIQLKDGERVNQLFSSDVEKVYKIRKSLNYKVDSVLLSLCPKYLKREAIVDLCVGNRAVGLFASTRTEARSLVSKLRNVLADMATRSHCPQWLEPANIMITDDLKHLPQHIGGKVDIILCNPPISR